MLDTLWGQRVNMQKNYSKFAHAHAHAHQEVTVFVWWMKIKQLFKS